MPLGHFHLTEKSCQIQKRRRTKTFWKYPMCTNLLLNKPYNNKKLPDIDPFNHPQILTPVSSYKEVVKRWSPHESPNVLFPKMEKGKAVPSFLAFFLRKKETFRTFSFHYCLWKKAFLLILSFWTKVFTSSSKSVQ